MTFETLADVENRLKELYILLADPAVIADTDRIRELGREHQSLEQIVRVWRDLDAVQNGVNEAREIIRENVDEDLLELARTEAAEGEITLDKLEKELRALLIPRDPDDSRNTIVEIRAGTGGEEAGLFGADLYRMYSHYAEKQGWKVEVMSGTPSELGGYKEIIFLVSGEDVYGKLRYESGVHRVQRVPATETQGRIHTSAASVVILLEAKDVEVALEPDELRIDVYRSSGPGGQSVNTTDSAVRVTHVPTGLVASCQDEKSQHKNKAKALKILRSRLLELRRKEQADSEAATRRNMVAGGDRSAKIRTYNFPQNRVTDHRIKLTLHSLQEILDGDLDEIIEAVRLAANTDNLNLSGKD
ncbi:peptide chain release factor 1 [Candidatus Zixiibacteriota bacterium]